ncbi:MULTISPECIES: hypothetical protein [Ralstonia solanacearum species complex]|uniref:hypothetical protein n=1 Tax=Ralstonia solanacearum species complex TaxID=3116862 RepID=UPI001071D098|nr:hypothetical protein [Ralstonia solanacearum]BEU74004.1 hypothetical protein MAFF211271_35590 [Ralstonia pseudosolanacearum]
MKRRRQVLLKYQRGSVFTPRLPAFNGPVASELRAGMARIGAELGAACSRLAGEWARMRERIVIQRKLRRMARDIAYGDQDIQWRREELIAAERNQSALELLYRQNEETLRARLAQLDRGL